MNAGRFVSYTFLYDGGLLLAWWFLVHDTGLDVTGLGSLAVALSLLAVAGARIRNPDVEAANPADYGPVAYGCGVLSGVITGVLVVQLIGI